MSIATAVFGVMILAAGANPQYAIVGEIKGTESMDAYHVCKASIPNLKISDEEKAKLSCIEVVLHNDKGERFETPVPSNNGRRMGNTTSWEILK